MSGPSDVSPGQGAQPGLNVADSAATAGDEAETEANAQDAERSVFFSDAVVAIAITLLALELPVPEGSSGMSNGQLLHALDNNLGDYLSCVISFIVIGNHWTVHRRTFRHVRRLNRAVNGYNMCWLLMMVLTPFAARLLAGDGAFGVRFGFYAVIQVIAIGCLMQIRRHLIAGGLLGTDATGADRHPDISPSLAMIAVFLVSIPVAFATSWAYALWGAIPLATRLARWIHGRWFALPPS